MCSIVFPPPSNPHSIFTGNPSFSGHSTMMHESFGTIPMFPWLFTQIKSLFCISSMIMAIFLIFWVFWPVEPKHPWPRAPPVGPKPHSDLHIGRQPFLATFHSSRGPMGHIRVAKSMPPLWAHCHQPFIFHGSFP